MYERIFDIENRLNEGMFLFGARQVGKSTLLKKRFPQAVYVDLLNSDLRKRFKQTPSIFKEMLIKYPAETLVIVDEIQKVPELLDEVHSLMVDHGLYFILSGSSARKIKNGGANQLGGRAIPETLFPLVSAEITDYDLNRAIQNGTIPSFLACLFSKESRDEIKSIEWDSDTILGFVCLFALGGLAIWGIIELELIPAALKALEILFF